MNPPAPIRIGIIGYGSLGQYLTDYIQSDEGKQRGLYLSFIYNRTHTKVTDSPNPSIHKYHLQDLNQISSTDTDLIVEVAHPSVSSDIIIQALNSVSYFCGSPACLSDQKLESDVREAVKRTHHSVYIPAGALWGSSDIQKMSSRGDIRGLTITMKKNPHHLRLNGYLLTRLEDIVAHDLRGDQVIYEGPVRPLCALAPNNVNTMACAALAAPDLGFDRTQCRLVANKELTGHVICVQIEGPGGLLLTLLVLILHLPEQLLETRLMRASLAAFLLQ